MLAAVCAPGITLVAPAPVAAISVRSASPVVAAAASAALGALDEWHSTNDPQRFVEYLDARDRAATEAAAELGLEPTELGAAWSSIDGRKQVALLAALSQLGVPYRSRASIEGEGFDCSGLTSFAWSRAGVSLARSSGDQIRAATPVDRASATAGDLVHYPGHVMLYLGVGDAIVHSRNTGSTVELSLLSSHRSVRFGDPLG